MEDFIGKQFGRLTVVELTEPTIDKHGKSRTTYICKCSCGIVRTVTRHQLQIKNGTRSCGCLNQESRSRLGLSKRKLHPREATAKALFDRTYADGNLTLNEFLELSQKNCEYCNSAPVSKYNKYLHRTYAKNSEFALTEGTFIYNGLDRVDSSLPHNKDNVVPCCIQCNWSKSNKNVEDFRQWVVRVYEHWAKEKAR